MEYLCFPVLNPSPGFLTLATATDLILGHLLLIFLTPWVLTRPGTPFLFSGFFPDFVFTDLSLSFYLMDQAIRIVNVKYNGCIWYYYLVFYFLYNAIVVRNEAKLNFKVHYCRYEDLAIHLLVVCELGVSRHFGSTESHKKNRQYS